MINKTSSKDVLKMILKTELGNVIGEKGLTNSELEDKRLADLQKEMGIVMEEKDKKRSGERERGKEKRRKEKESQKKRQEERDR